jgi:hypothetical protein
MKITRIALLALAGTGCFHAAHPAAYDPQNAFSRSFDGDWEFQKRVEYLPPAHGMVVLSSHNLESDTRRLIRQGYGLIGLSEFTDRIDSTWEAQLHAHATSIGAEAILVDVRLRGRAPGDSALRAHYDVEYFARTRFRLGVLPSAVPDSTRDRLGSRYGVWVYERADDSPAGRAGIQSGDVLLQIGGEMLRSVPDYYRLLAQEEGKRVELMLDRGGRLIVKQVEIASLR